MKTKTKYHLRRSVSSILLLLPAACIISAGITIAPIFKMQGEKFELTLRQREIITELSNSEEFKTYYNNECERLESKYTLGNITFNEYQNSQNTLRSVQGKISIINNIETIDKSEFDDVSNQLINIQKQEDFLENKSNKFLTIAAISSMFVTASYLNTYIYKDKHFEELEN